MKPEKPLTKDDIPGLPDDLTEAMKKSGLIRDKNEDDSEDE